MDPMLAYIMSPMGLLIVGLVVLLLFGDRLPKVMRSLGRGVVEFKKGVAGIEDELEAATRGDSKKITEVVDEAPKAPAPAAEAEVKKAEA